MAEIIELEDQIEKVILVGVALETVKSLEAQMLMRHYKGFLE